MAGLGYRTFTAGQVLTAAQVQDYLQDQVVMVFDSAAARSSALGTIVAEGMVSYLKDTNSVEYFNASSWQNVADQAIAASIPRSVLTSAGDLITASGSGVPVRLAAGSAGSVLTSNGSTLFWASGAEAPTVNILPNTVTTRSGLIAGTLTLPDRQTDATFIVNPFRSYLETGTAIISGVQVDPRTAYTSTNTDNLARITSTIVPRTTTLQVKQSQDWANALSNGSILMIGMANGILFRRQTSPNQLESSTDGVNWTSVLSFASDPGQLSLAFGNSIFVLMAQSGSAYWTSTNGTSWTQRTAINASSTNTVGFGNGVFVGTGFESSGNWRILTSTDGINWTLRVSSIPSQLVGFPVWLGGSTWYVAHTQLAQQRRSTDNGATWSTWTSNFGGGTYRVDATRVIVNAQSGGSFSTGNIGIYNGTTESQITPVFNAGGKTVFSSTNGNSNVVSRSFTGISTGTLFSQGGVFYALGQFAVSEAVYWMSSTDLTNWSIVARHSGQASDRAINTSQPFSNNQGVVTIGSNNFMFHPGMQQIGRSTGNILQPDALATIQMAEVPALTTLT